MGVLHHTSMVCSRAAWANEAESVHGAGFTLTDHPVFPMQRPGLFPSREGYRERIPVRWLGGRPLFTSIPLRGSETISYGAATLCFNALVIRCAQT